ncbi:MAG: heavy-metal-associated domain-containing protein [Cyclobacteriaceae bacterium]|nr:heavy-metal-associated domain-containing protein [Cyclobacteriaceae bacterium]
MNSKYGIVGMTCEHCAARVQKALMNHPQVANAKVTLAAGEAELELKAPVTVEELQAVVSKAGGYQVQPR